MTLRVAGDATKLEALSAANPDAFKNVLEKAKQRGVISHHFYATTDAILVVDEWPSEEAFHSFYDESTPEIAGFMQEAGVTAQPEITFLRKLDLGDDFG